MNVKKLKTIIENRIAVLEDEHKEAQIKGDKMLVHSKLARLGELKSLLYQHF